MQWQLQSYLAWQSVIVIGAFWLCLQNFSLFYRQRVEEVISALSNFPIFRYRFSPKCIYQQQQCQQCQEKYFVHNILQLVLAVAFLIYVKISAYLLLRPCFPYILLAKGKWGEFAQKKVNVMLDRHASVGASPGVPGAPPDVEHDALGRHLPPPVVQPQRVRVHPPVLLSSVLTTNPGDTHPSLLLCLFRTLQSGLHHQNVAGDGDQTLYSLSCRFTSSWPHHCWHWYC